MDEKLFYDSYKEWLVLYEKNAKGENFSDRTASSYRAYLKEAFRIISKGYENILSLDRITFLYMSCSDEERTQLKRYITNILYDLFNKRTDKNEKKQIRNSLCALKYYWGFVCFIKSEDPKELTAATQQVNNKVLEISGSVETKEEKAQQIVKEVEKIAKEQSKPLTKRQLRGATAISALRGRLTTQTRGDRNICYPVRILNAIYKDFFDSQKLNIRLIVSKNGDYIFTKDLKNVELFSDRSIYVVDNKGNNHRLYARRDDGKIIEAEIDATCDFMRTKEDVLFRTGFAIDHCIPISPIMDELLKEGKIPRFKELTELINKDNRERLIGSKGGDAEYQKKFIERNGLRTNPFKNDLLQEMKLIDQCVAGLEYTTKEYNSIKKDTVYKEDILPLMKLNDLQVDVRKCLNELLQKAI